MLRIIVAFTVIVVFIHVSCNRSEVHLTSMTAPETKLTNYDEFGNLVEELICDDRNKLKRYYAVFGDTIVETKLL